MVCEDHFLQVVLNELMRTHPYETPAYAAWKIENHIIEFSQK